MVIDHDFAVMLRQPRSRLHKRRGSLAVCQDMARCLGADRSTRTVAPERVHLRLDTPHRGQAMVPTKVGKLADQNRSQPAPPFDLGTATKALKSALGLEEGFLDEIRRTAVGL